MTKEIPKDNTEEKVTKEEIARAEHETGEEGVAQTLLAVMLFADKSVGEILYEKYNEAGGEDSMLDVLRRIEHSKSDIHDAISNALLAWVSHPKHPSRQFREILEKRPEFKERVDKGDRGVLREIAELIDLG